MKNIQLHIMKYILGASFDFLVLRRRIRCIIIHFIRCSSLLRSGSHLFQQLLRIEHTITQLVLQNNLHRSVTIEITWIVKKEDVQVRLDLEFVPLLAFLVAALGVFRSPNALHYFLSNAAFVS